MAAVKQSFPEITKSAEDGRNYRGLELKNGLKVLEVNFCEGNAILSQVLLVSDPSTDKAAAAMDVHIGHMSDPPNLPGLAHFCEHMLFLGWILTFFLFQFNTYVQPNQAQRNSLTRMNTASI